jgi:hypothetical protein
MKANPRNMGSRRIAVFKTSHKKACRVTLAGSGCEALSQALDSFLESAGLVLKEVRSAVLDVEPPPQLQVVSLSEIDGLLGRSKFNARSAVPQPHPARIGPFKWIAGRLVTGLGKSEVFPQEQASTGLTDLLLERAGELKRTWFASQPCVSNMPAANPPKRPSRIEAMKKARAKGHPKSPAL